MFEFLPINQLEARSYMDDYRAEFLVTEGRKLLWEKELLILDFIENICNNNRIDYFLIGGAAIGAVRHNGFIPWDDDMDIGMLRKDFDRFIEIFKKQDSKYVLQYGINRDDEKSTFLRIRDPEGTAVIKNQIHDKSKTHGIFIEIYPFDEVPTNRIIREFNRSISSLLKAELDFRIDHKYLPFKAKVSHLFLYFLPDETLWRVWQSLCKKYNGRNMEFVDTPSLPAYAKMGIHLYKRSDVSSTVHVPFEDRLVRIAKGNHECLTIHFGDYMKLPPIEERNARHYDIVYYDPYTPCKEYVNSDIPDRYFTGEFELSKI